MVHNIEQMEHINVHLAMEEFSTLPLSFDL
jgi:hypothetical protein